MSDNTSSSASSSSTQNFVTLVSNDGQEFMIPKNAIRRSSTMNELMEKLSCADVEEGTTERIPVDKVKGKILEMIVLYCNKHIDDPIQEEEYDTSTISDWDKDFLNVDQTTLHDLIVAAESLHINNLLDVCCQTVADMIKGKSVDEMRRIYNIPNDYTQDEEDQIKKENAWCEI